MEKQQTLKAVASYSGITLHTGVRATLRINPAEENFGIWFRRVDKPGAPMVRAVVGNVVDVRRGTTIAQGEAVVATVEHVMASLHVCGVDNAIVDMTGPEPPILDGSAIEFLQGIIDAGVVEQSAEAEFLNLTAPVTVDHGNTQLAISPAESLRIHCTASFKNCPFDPQFFSLEITRESFLNEIARARTFVDYNDLRQLLAMGLIKGGSLDNAAILHNGAIICKDHLNWQNEIVRHKILDIVGDLYLTGRRVRGNVVAVKPGHPSNVALAQEIVKQISQKSN